MKAQSINLSGICHSVLRILLRGRRIQQGEGQVGRPSITHKTKPRRLRGLAKRTGRWGSGGSGPIRARLVNVSRASSKEVQKSLAGLRVIHRWRVRPTSPFGVLVDPGAKAGRAELKGHHIPSLLGVRLPDCSAFRYHGADI